LYLEPAAEGVAGDLGDEDQRGGLHLAEHLVHQQHRHPAPARAALLESPHVGAGGKELGACAAEDDGPDLLVDPGVVDGGAKLAGEGDVIAVGGRPVHSYDAHAALLLQAYRHSCHPS